MPLPVLLCAAFALAGCGAKAVPTAASSAVPAAGVAATAASNGVTPTPTTTTSTPAPTSLPTAKPKPKRVTVRRLVVTTPVLRAGNPTGHARVPAAARAVNTTHPRHVIGSGSPAGCTSAAVVKAVASGGVITFDCGPAPVTITLTQTAKVINAHPDVVLDGGGKVTLSGAGRRRILYQNTCDQAQGWTSTHCDDQPHPQLTVQNLTFADGNATGQTTDGGGGGAIFVRGGRLKVVNSRFVDNSCDRTGPDLGGAAIRALSQSGGQPVYIVSSTFEGGSCSNGGALSSIGVTWVVLNSLIGHNSAVGHGANPASSGTPGGGSGGAIYTDGNTYTVTVAGTLIEDNHANEGAGALFFVSNDHTGRLMIIGSTLRQNRNDQFSTQGYPGIFYLGVGSHPTVTASSLH